MPIETLVDKRRISIRNMQVEHGEKKPELTSFQLYNELKRTVLYDHERKQWNEFMRDEDSPEFVAKNRIAFDQLLGVWVEAQFNKKEAWENLERLKDTPLYDNCRGQWNEMIKENQKLEDTGRHSNSQLMGVLVEAQFDHENAQSHYEQLKQTKLYDPQKEQWNWFMNEDQNEAFYDNYTEYQLLGILVEAQFDKQKAEVRYRELKTTEMYDSIRCQWTSGDSLGPQDTLRNPADQILGIIIESMFNNEEAQDKYRKLKETPLYDKVYKRWNLYMNGDQEVQSTLRDTPNQLLGIIVEKMFEKEKLQLHNEPLPKVRIF